MNETKKKGGLCKMKTEQYLCELTNRIWHYYLLNPTEENFEKIIQTWSDNFSMIGTGKHEIYTSAEEAIENIEKNQTDAQQIQFDILDEWYRTEMLSETIGIVYGGIWVREHAEKDTEALVEMDTRFSIVYTRNETGEWKMVHLHHSIPYFDQEQNEYYPKALSTKVREALTLVELFKKRSEMDLMTAVYNHESFQRQVEIYLQKEKSIYFYILDLDDFKAVNDTYGHGTGDSLLKFLARLLQKYFCESGIVGRIGGDEFAICEFGALEKEKTEKKLLAMWDEYKKGVVKITKGNFASYSIGIVQNHKENMTYRQLFKCADEALYCAKHMGKDRFLWYSPKQKLSDK